MLDAGSDSDPPSDSDASFGEETPSPVPKAAARKPGAAKKAPAAKAVPARSPLRPSPAANLSAPAPAASDSLGGRAVEDVYQKKTQLEHILLRPDTYVGSTERQQVGRGG